MSQKKSTQRDLTESQEKVKDNKEKESQKFLTPPNDALKKELFEGRPNQTCEEVSRINGEKS